MSGDRSGFVVNNRSTSITCVTAAGALLICMFSVFGLAGCTRSEKSNFYILDSLDRFSPATLNAEAVDISVGIGPLTIPEYLNRTQIVTRSGRYELEIAEFERWAETLEDAIPRVLAENLSVLLSTDRVFTYPWLKETPAYQLKIEVIQFDGSIPGNVELTARWTLLKDDRETLISRRKYIAKKPIAGQGYSGLVSAMSLVLYDLSREIAGGVMMEFRSDTVENDM